MHTWNLQFIFTRMSKKVKYEDGGIVVGKSHDDGGVKFKVNGTNTKVELEGKEVVLSSRAFSDPKTYTYEGTNFEILNNINKAYGGNPLTKKVEELGVNDFVVCILSVQDPTVRKITGTNEQIISTINGTGGCVTTHKGQAAVDIIKKKYGQGGNISNVNGVTLKKVKSFTTDEGSFDIYDTEKDGARGRVDMFTVFKDKNGWIIRNAFVPDALQKKGIATDFYKRMNEASLKATKKPLRSTQERTLNSGEKVHELSANAIQLWESLVRNGFAEKLSEKNYRFVKQSKFKKGGEILKGGKADGMTLQAIAKHHKVTLREVYKQWNKGRKHEQEHTSNIGMASEIAKDHIYERLDYYDMLNKAESKYENGNDAQEIKCVKCGWEWNANDSREHDKYVCHKCGHDNAKMLYAKGGLIAPNGKKSNLTPEQYKLVRTPEFKAWFGDWENYPKNASKVVDENGEPLVVYRLISDDLFSKDKYNTGSLTTGIQKATNWTSNKLKLAQKKATSNAIVGDRVYDMSEKKMGAIIEIVDSYHFVILFDDGKIQTPPNTFNLTVYSDDENSKDIQSAFLNIRIMGDGSKVLSHSFSSQKDSGLKVGEIYQTFSPTQVKLADGTNTTFDSSNADIRYAQGGEIKTEAEIYQKWSNLVNMSASEVEDFYDSEEGKVAGLSQEEAKEKGIGSGRQSARWIIRMKRTPKERWTPTMWEWAKRQISFISRMSGVQGELYNDKGEKTRKHLSLLIWGHNPNKKNSGGQVYESNQTTNMYTFRISENIPSEIKNSVTDIVKAINIQVKNNVYGYLIDRKNAKINILIKNELDEKKLSELEGFMTQTLKSQSVKEQYRMRTFDLYPNVVSIKFPIANFKTT